jgi:carbon-monoxide dehydrogenase iron sulfur subunit|uniref:4Fe-4S dicluster domain-containing protein n=1 Tax=Desulfobacca acetoxidans TaxID=60893 RepID=A0A7C5EUK8_9BACT
MKEIFVNLDRCQGCRSCQLACAVAHSRSQNLFGALGETPAPRYRLYVERGLGLNVPLTCRHCDPAPCMEACIAGALYRDERGAVRRREGACVGCWTCLMVCPYGVVGREKEHKVAVKCDLCPDREVPACVAACPTRALLYREAEGFAAGVRHHAAEVLARSKELA